ncbi:hypothetical protein F4804DRAFT_347134 [Jackrogersella minutella]|nr:hypothetical protein F4804DRAFT_347134 [Jackrogersella minutella]
MADHHEKRDEEEEEDEIGEQDYKAQKDALIFAIDVSVSMLRAPPKSDDKKADKDLPVYAALKCAYQVMQQRIISNPKDMMGIVLFGTEKTKYRDGQNLLHHCYVYTDLDIPAGDDVKSLKSLVEEGEDADEILVPATEGVQMSNLFFLSKILLTTKAPNFGSRRIFIITDNDDPHKDDKALKENAARQAKDLYDLGVTIELFAITQGDDKFDFSKFYDDIIYRDPAVEEAHPGKISTSKSGSGLTLLNSLISNINSKQTPKRAYFSNMPLELGSGLQISVKGYNIIQKQAPARSCYVWLDGEKAQIAVGETAQVAEDSARTVQAGEVKKAYKFGGEYVYFSEDEQKSIKQFGGPIIRIIGFKDRSQLGFWASIKKSIFIFPSEEGYVGSSRVFTALWQKLIKSKKIGIAWHVARTNADPRLVAIIPSNAQSDRKTGVAFIPAGLWLYPIPYADDVREGPDHSQLVRTTDHLTDAMNKIIGNLQLPTATYNPSKYPNPALQWHYKILQALALEEEVPDKSDDATLPKYKAIHNRCGAYIQDWSRTADDVLTMMKDAKAIKREMETDDGDDEPRPTKKSRTTTPKAGLSGAGMDNAELKKRYNDGTLTKLTVAELKPILDDRSIPSKGLKKVLIERLSEWIEDNVNSPRGNYVCNSIREIQEKLHYSLASKTTDTRAERTSITFELRHNTVFHLEENPGNSAIDGPVDPAQQSQHQPITRSVNVSETVQSQPADDPVLQRAVAKHIVGCMGVTDSSSWLVRQVSKGAQGWTFTYVCKDSLQAWNRANEKSTKKPVIGNYSGIGDLDPTNASRPAFDCRGTLTISFAKSTRSVIVKYNHTPIHKTVAQLLELLAPDLPPAPVNNGKASSQRTPRAKPPPPTEGETGSRKKRARRMGKAPEAPMGDVSVEGSQVGQNGTESQSEGPSNIRLTSVLSIPPDEAARRERTAIELLTGRGVDPATLSKEQFEIFSNQAPDLQATSLDMLERYGAEKLVVIPEGKDKIQPPPSTSTPAEGPFADATPTTASVPISIPGTTDTPTKRRARKRKSDKPAAEVTLCSGATVPVDQDGEVGPTTSTLKPTGRRTDGNCQACKDRKMKCMREHPSCSICIEAGVECVYLPPKTRARKSGIPAGIVENEDSDLPGESEQYQAQIEAQETIQMPAVPDPDSLHHLAHYIDSWSPDSDNEEFIPDPNILSPPAHPPTTQYYQNNSSGVAVLQDSQPTLGHTSIPAMTFPESRARGTQFESSPNSTFPSTSHQAEHPSRLTFPQPASTTKQKGQRSPTANRHMPVIPQHTPVWNNSSVPGQAATSSPPLTKQQVSQQSKSRNSSVEASQQTPDNLKHAAMSSQAAMQRASQPSPSRQGHRSQTNTPVTSTSRLPPQAPQTAISASYNTKLSTSTNGQYDSSVNDQNSSHIAYQPGSYHPNTNTTTSASTTSSNPLSQALNTSTGYNDTSNPTTNQWATSQTRGSKTYNQPNASSTYSMAPAAAAAPTSHSYGTRPAKARTARYSNNRSSGYGSVAGSNQGTYNSHRPNVPNYPGHSHGSGTADQPLYDLLAAGSSAH